MIAETAENGILLRLAITVPIEIYTKEGIAEFEKEDAGLAMIFKKKGLR